MTFDDLFDRYLRPMYQKPTDMAPSGILKKPVRAILFDLYGTLFISGSGGIGTARFPDASKRAIEELIRSYDLGFSPDQLIQDFQDAVRAEHDRMKARRIDYPEVRVEQIWSKVLGIEDPDAIKRFAVAFELIANPVWPMPGLNRLLTVCRSAGLTMGIISNAQFYTPLIFERFCDAIPESLGFDPELIIYSYEIGRAKPSPILFDTAVNVLNNKRIDADYALFVGNDMRNDISAAHAAGMRTALFAGDRRSFRSRPDDPCCAGLVPDLCITDLGQIPERIGIRMSRKLLEKADPD